MLGRAILKPLASIVIGQEAIGRLSPSGEGRSGDASCPEHRTGKDRLCEAIPSARRASPMRRDRSCHSGEGSRCRSRLPTRYVRLRGMLSCSLIDAVLCHVFPGGIPGSVPSSSRELAQGASFLPHALWRSDNPLYRTAVGREQRERGGASVCDVNQARHLPASGHERRFPRARQAK